MDGLDRGFISRVSEAVIKAYNIETPIVDVNTTVDNMGGSIILTSDLPIYADGKIKKKEENSFEIYISKLQSEQRKRFTIAHELGHLFLHMGYQIDKNMWEKSSAEFYREGNSNIEYEAHEFAANFLMPEAIFKTRLKEYTSDNKVNIIGLANYFNVSVSAVINRGKWLGVFEWNS